MFYKAETQLGNIGIEKAVIGRIITEAVEEFHGKVVISNYKGKVSGLVAKIGGIDDVNYMEITLGEKGLDIKVFIMIKFGTSISKVTDQLIRNIKNNVEEFTGMEANSIAVVVTGMFSKQIVKRNIEVRG
ncbi:Asp23/Gls24 family envelope stress response protein [Sinanaerobacter chloroacetimidivorans]|uniref:Asp23/Gls24 family envelope stress response protein n=1 Tax=Sinanaerobacter chloroacetimidivorans TaxID=2818044 RepID=A0A8J8AZT8_9FIRM|nr:Asp23/Gls24 family envelope stress response protein [Sinanaerobacter chloroacetimidivorans]MBR0596529.1 Asp23/Gls24 family envelope stress response protein [Sinanaerobacter chloroacetimidivorans]